MSKPCNNQYLPVQNARFPQMVEPGDIVFIGQYLFTGSETTSVYMEVGVCVS
jgi:pyruvate kinase